MTLKSSIGPSNLDPGKATSHVCSLKKLATRVIKYHVFCKQESQGTVSYILVAKWVKWLQ